MKKNESAAMKHKLAAIEYNKKNFSKAVEYYEGPFVKLDYFNYYRIFALPKCYLSKRFALL